MTQYESAIQLLAERLNGVDASASTSIAEILATALQELVEAELTTTIGADHGERFPRTAQRNGHRHKLLSTPAGDIWVTAASVASSSMIPTVYRLCRQPSLPDNRVTTK